MPKEGVSFEKSTFTLPSLKLCTVPIAPWNLGLSCTTRTVSPWFRSFRVGVLARRLLRLRRERERRRLERLERERLFRERERLRLLLERERLFRERERLGIYRPSQCFLPGHELNSARLNLPVVGLHSDRCDRNIEKTRKKTCKNRLNKPFKS